MMTPVAVLALCGCLAAGAPHSTPYNDRRAALVMTEASNRIGGQIELTDTELKAEKVGLLGARPSLWLLPPGQGVALP